MSRIDIIGQNGNDGLHYAPLIDYKARVGELSLAHWDYIFELLTAHNVDDNTIAVAEFHYKTAAVHFYKHAIEDIEAGYYEQG